MFFLAFLSFFHFLAVLVEILRMDCQSCLSNQEIELVVCKTAKRRRTAIANNTKNKQEKARDQCEIKILECLGARAPCESVRKKLCEKAEISH
jgi:hypothetical protein